jgi:hypothetical protein
MSMMLLISLCVIDCLVSNVIKIIPWRKFLE